jgi:hypothetical protein
MNAAHPRASLRVTGALLACLAGASFAGDFAIATNNGTITITGYGGTNSAVVIPPTINGLPVTRIGDNAFSGCATMTHLTISSNVTSIGNAAFYDCVRLAALEIPAGVTNIGDAAFGNCEALTGIFVAEANAFFSSDNGILFDKSQGTLIRCPGGKTGDYGIPPGVLAIRSSAFDRCLGLTTLTVPASVTHIGSFAFRACSSLESITVAADNPAYRSDAAGVLYDKDMTLLLQCPGGWTGHYTMPDGVTNLTFYAFDGCTNLTGVTIGAGLAVLPTFSECVHLAALEVAAGNASFSSAGGVLFDAGGTTLLMGPPGLAGHYSVPGGVTTIASYAFDQCARLTHVTLPSSVRTLGYSAFSACSGLLGVTLTDGLADLGPLAFASCGGLRYVTVPDTVTNIGAKAFNACSNLAGITLGSGVAMLGDYAFGACPSLRDLLVKGRPPAVQNTNTVFAPAGSSQAAVYYLPGTTGWGATFCGRPTFPWDPRAISGAGGFGVDTNGFGFTFTNAGSPSIVVEACTNLMAPAWIRLSTNTLTDGSSGFRDHDWTHHASRFYRFASP